MASKLRLEEKKQAGLWPPRRAVILGCGGIGSNLWDLIANQTAVNAKMTAHGNPMPHVTDFILLDGDAVEAKNLARQSFYPEHVGMGKAEALVSKWSPFLSEYGVNTEYKREWLTEDSNFFQDQDIVLAGFDNNTSRLILNNIFAPRGKNLLKNVIVISGGNADTLVTVQVMVKTQNKIQTATLEHRHPEITKPEDKHPRHAECTSEEGMANDPQLFRANQHAADLMFNYFINALEARFLDNCGVWFDVGNFNFRKEDIPDKEVIIE